MQREQVSNVFIYKERSVVDVWRGETAEIYHWLTLSTATPIASQNPYLHLDQTFGATFFFMEIVVKGSLLKISHEKKKMGGMTHCASEMQIWE